MNRYLLGLILLFFAKTLLAHPMPSSVVKLSVLERSIKGVAIMPLPELESAIKQQHITNFGSAFFSAYFIRHIRAVSGGKPWQTSIENISLKAARDQEVGNYQQVIVAFRMIPPDAALLRKFTFDYSVIVHEVITHRILVYIEQDWQNGIHGGENARQAGIIKLDIPTEKVYPLEVNIENGSFWTGFKSMITLGMQHIAEGTDHLLFLLVLLLPAPLIIRSIRHWQKSGIRHREELSNTLVQLVKLVPNPNETISKAWGGFGGVRYSLVHILRVVTAFTIGHSITLALGVLGLIHAPAQIIEVLIAVSILISAVHAIYPVFPHKEMYIAGGFGLIHGLAFASTLADLNLETGRLVLSILGFNIGIELMQSFVIVMVIPWLILLSRLPVYRFVCMIGAAFAAIAAAAWIAERVSGKSNPVSLAIVKFTAHAPYLVAVLALVTGISYLIYQKPDKKDFVKKIFRKPATI